MLVPRAKNNLFLEYKTKTKGCLLFDLYTRGPFYFRHVFFYESIFYYEESNVDGVSVFQQDPPKKLFDTSYIIYATSNNTDQQLSPQPHSQVATSSPNFVEEQSIRRFDRPRYPPTYLKDFHCKVVLKSTCYKACSYTYEKRNKLVQKRGTPLLSMVLKHNAGSLGN